MKTEVYSWRLSAERKAELEAEARREGTSLSGLLDRVTAGWLAERRNGRSDDEANRLRFESELWRRSAPSQATIRHGARGPANWFEKSFTRST